MLITEDGIMVKYIKNFNILKHFKEFLKIIL
jgi:hypothetical protein